MKRLLLLLGFSTLLTGCFEGGITIEDGELTGINLESPLIEGLFCSEEDAGGAGLGSVDQFAIGNAQFRIFNENSEDVTNDRFEATVFGGTFAVTKVDKDNFASLREEILTDRYINNPAYIDGDPVTDDNDPVMLANHGTNQYLPVTQFTGGSALLERATGRLVVTAHFDMVYWLEGHEPWRTGDQAYQRIFGANRLIVNKCQVFAEIFGVTDEDDKLRMASFQNKVQIQCSFNDQVDLADNDEVLAFWMGGAWSNEWENLSIAEDEMLDLNVIDGTNAILLEDGHLRLTLPIDQLASIPGIGNLGPAFAGPLKDLVPNGVVAIDSTLFNPRYPEKTDCTAEDAVCPPEPAE